VIDKLFNDYKNEVEKMPTSKKRKKVKPKQEVEVAVKNPLHTTTGKVVVVILAGGFVLSVITSAIIMVVNYFGR
jgi:predicted ThiF/HesA family dinucleotide-utilizing enzyme